MAEERKHTHTHTQFVSSSPASTPVTLNHGVHFVSCCHVCFQRWWSFKHLKLKCFWFRQIFWFLIKRSVFKAGHEAGGGLTPGFQTPPRRLTPGGLKNVLVPNLASSSGTSRNVERRNLIFWWLVVFTKRSSDPWWHHHKEYSVFSSLDLTW